MHHTVAVPPAATSEARSLSSLVPCGSQESGELPCLGKLLSRNAYTPVGSSRDIERERLR